MSFLNNSGLEENKITLKPRYKSSKIVYSEKFILEKELVDTGISKYYTWDYLGDRYLDIFDCNCELGDPYHGSSVCEDTYTLEVERFGNLEGSVSISLSKVDTSI